MLSMCADGVLSLCTFVVCCRRCEVLRLCVVVVCVYVVSLLRVDVV